MVFDTLNMQRQLPENTELNAMQIEGTVLKEWLIPAAGNLGISVKKGQVVRVIDIEGQQIMDFVCFNKDNPEEKLWIGASIINNGNIFFQKGHSLYSKYQNKMFTMIEDSCGVHDLLIGHCTPEVYQKVYGLDNHHSCADNFVAALEPFGLDRKDIPMNLNIFMNCPVSEDGGYRIECSVSRPGDFVDLQADMDCIVAMSNCPGDTSPENGYKLTPMKVVLYQPD